MKFSIPILSGLIILIATSCITTPPPAASVIASWGEEEKNVQREAGTQLLRKLAQAKLDGEKIFTIPKGDYRFFKTSVKGAHKSFITLDGYRDIVIDGSGSTFWFEHEAWGFHITGSSNTTMKNIILDWDPLPYTQGVIVGMNPKEKTLDVKISPGYEAVSKRFASLPPEGNEKAACVRGYIFDAKKDLFKPCQEGFRVVPFFQTPKINGAYRIKTLVFYNKPLENLNAKIGDRIALVLRGGGGILMEGCGNMLLEDVTLYSCPGLQFVEGACNERNTYRRCKVLPRPGTDRLMGGNADGFHSQNCENGPIIENCEITSIGDDAVNIHGFYRKVLAQNSPNEVVVENFAWRQKLKGNCTVDFYESPAKGFDFLGERKVLACRFENGKHILTLDKPVIVENDSVCSIEEYTGPGAIIRNCHWKNIYTRGILFKSHNAVIENNVMEWIGSWGILLTTQPGFWGESAMPHGVKIRGNIITDVFGQAAIGLIDPAKDFSKAQRVRDISITNNTITRTDGPGIMLRGTDGVQIIGNSISGDHTDYSVESGAGEYLSQKDGASIEAEDSRNLLEKDNTIPGADMNGRKRSCR
ncbi:MAG: right-handed parallel beta-helix repeat-containing protein [Victivallales bacterium]